MSCGFFGLIVMARIVGRRGEMWDWKKPIGVRLTVNVSQYMKKYCFEQIQRFVIYFFQKKKT